MFNNNQAKYTATQKEKNAYITATAATLALRLYPTNYLQLLFCLTTDPYVVTRQPNARVPKSQATTGSCCYNCYLLYPVLKQSATGPHTVRHS